MNFLCPSGTGRRVLWVWEEPKNPLPGLWRVPGGSHWSGFRPAKLGHMKSKGRNHGDGAIWTKSPGRYVRQTFHGRPTLPGVPDQRQPNEPFDTYIETVDNLVNQRQGRHGGAPRRPLLRISLDCGSSCPQQSTGRDDSFNPLSTTRGGEFDAPAIRVKAVSPSRLGQLPYCTSGSSPRKEVVAPWESMSRKLLRIRKKPRDAYSLGNCG
jgi:hypothetical protein